MPEEVKIGRAEVVEVERIDGNVVVTFSDGRVTTLDPNDIYLTSVEVSAKNPPEEAK